MSGRTVARAAALIVGALVLQGCPDEYFTVDVGDNFVPPDVQLDEDYFHCRVQPDAIASYTCAGGAAGEGGSCHTARSALRLSLAAETDPRPECADLGGDRWRVTGSVPGSYMQNLEAVRLSVQSDPLSSPLYRRPLGLDSHPRAIFTAADPGAQIIQTWISRGAM